MAVSEQTLVTWSKPLSKTEDAKCQNALSQVTAAVRKRFGNSVTIFIQGSYENNTNVRQNSDVDIVIRYDNTYFPSLVLLSEAQLQVFNQHITNATYTFSQFKDDIQSCLSSTFGADTKRKNKCIYIKGNTNRVNADVVPCFALKRMRDPYAIDAEGIKFLADDGESIESYPKQHYAKGVAKNTSTFRMYKRTVRMLKNIRNNLIDGGIINEKLMSSFFIESLVYNVNNANFNPYNYTQTLKNVITQIYNDMADATKVNKYLEVSELVYLFRGSSRSASDARDFMLKCWQYAGF